MTKFQTSKSEMTEFLNCVKLKGKTADGQVNLIDECVIKVEDDFIQTAKPDTTMNTYINVKMLVDVEEDGEIPLGDLDEFEKQLKRMNGTISISLDGNFIIMEDSVKRFSIPCYSMKEEAVSNGPVRKEDGVYKMGNIPFKTSFKINTKHLKEIVDDGDVLNIRIFQIKASKEKVSIGVEEDKKGSVVYPDLPVEDYKGEDIQIDLGFGFANMFSNIKGNVTFYITDGVPMYFETDETSDLEIKGIIAPWVEED